MSEKKSMLNISKFENMDAMEEICLKYGIKPSEVTLFIPLYYPIAIVKFNMRERVFEDIDKIPYIILKLLSLGINKSDAISEITGLMENYVSSMLDIMRANCQIDELGKLTDVGRDSIKEKQNIRLVKEEQCFQIDTLTGKIIKQKQVIKETELYGLREASLQRNYIMGMSGVEEEYIKKQIMSGDANQYIECRGDILHTNVEYIDAVEYVETKYAKAYLMEVRDYIGEPLIFSMRINKKSRNISDKFSFQPYFVWKKSQLTNMGMEGDAVPIVSGSLTKYSIRLFLQLANEEKNKFIATEKYRSNIEKIVKNVFPLDISVEDINLSSEYIGLVEIEPQMIKKCNVSFIHLLWLMLNYGAAYISAEGTGGGLIKIGTQNDRIFRLISLYGKAIGVKNRREIKNELLNEFSSHDGINLVEDIEEYLEKQTT